MVNGRLRYREAAEYLGIAEITLRRWVSERRIEHLKVGKAVLFNPADLEAFIESNRVPAVGPSR